MDEQRELSYTPARAPQTTVYHSPTALHLHNMFGMQKTWLGFSVLTACRVFIMGIRLRWLRCGAVFHLCSELLNANGIFVIIRQSSCIRSCNHHCHLNSLLKLRCRNRGSNGWNQNKATVNAAGERESSRDFCVRLKTELISVKSKAYREANLHWVGS